MEFFGLAQLQNETSGVKHAGRRNAQSLNRDGTCRVDCHSSRGDVVFHSRWINGRKRCIVFGCNACFDAKSLCDHLVSLSSLSSFGDTSCGFDLVIARPCMTRLGATLRWAPTDSWQADAFTKDSADAVVMIARTNHAAMSSRRRRTEKTSKSINSCQHPVIVLAIITGSNRQAASE